MSYSLFILYIIISVFGLLGMKEAPSMLSPVFLMSGLSYLIGAAVWVLILRSHPISLAFPFASSGLIIATALAGWLFLGESLSPLRIAGLIFILLGMLIISRSQ